MIDDSVDSLACEQAFIQASVQEIVMDVDNVIDCFHFIYACNEFVVVWLKYLIKHVI